MNWVKTKLQRWSVPVAIFGLGIISFGLLIPTLGFYWDDWETIQIIKLFPLSQFWTYFAGNRPLAGWTFIVFAPLLGVNPVAWQVFSLFLRILTSISMWWVFTQIWPAHQNQVTYAALLFTVYPIFIQQPISVAYHQHWLAYLLFFISLGLMIYAEKHPAAYVWLTLLSVLTLFLHLSILEYFIGLELLRPVLLSLVIPNQGSRKKTALAVLKKWLPYLLCLVLFFIWRMNYALTAESDNNAPGLLLSILKQPVSTLVDLAQKVLQDMLLVTFSSWYQTLQPALIDLKQRFSLFTWGVSILAAVGTSIYLWKCQANEPANEDHGWLKQMFWIGVLSALLGTLPIWTTGRQTTGGGLNADRFSMASMFGISLVWVSALEWALKNKMQVVIFLSVLIGLSTGLHLRVAEDYRWSWTQQKRVYWNLVWRAPGIQPDTAFFSFNSLFKYVHPTYSFNLLYQQPEQPDKLSYFFYLINSGTVQDMPSLTNGMELTETFRGATFQANSRNSLVIYSNPQKSSCLWILSPDDNLDPGIPDSTKAALPLSNFSRILPEPTSPGYPDATIFGKEPAQDWCYFFEKAELARQNQNWDEVAALGNQVLEKNYSPQKSGSNSPHEWLPFIEGFARTGQVEEAAKLTFASLETDKNYQPVFCQLWQRVKKDSAQDTQNIHQTLSQLNCSE